MKRWQNYGMTEVEQVTEEMIDLVNAMEILFREILRKFVWFCKDCITVEFKSTIFSQETQISSERDGDFILCCKFASYMKDKKYTQTIRKDSATG